MTVLWAYEEYCGDCYAEGEVPVSYWAWKSGQQ